MTALTPLVYASYAEELGLPALREPALSRLASVLRRGPEPLFPTSARWRIDERSLAVPIGELLRPIALEPTSAEIPGVPLLGREQMLALFGDAGPADGASELGGRWWEFWPTYSDVWAMFPGDAEPSPQLALVLPRSTRHEIELRVLEFEIAFGRGGLEPSSPISPDPGGCIHVLEEDEPGAPYRGSCRNDGCPQKCTPRVVFQPDDGRYVLLGCRC